MKWMCMSMAAFTVIALGATSSLAVAANPVCVQTCNSRYTDCLSAGRDQYACLGGWHQCKNQCAGTPRTVAATPVKMTVVSKPAPLAKKPAKAHAHR